MKHTFIACLLLFWAEAEAQTTRIHLFRTSRSGELSGERIFPIQNGGKPLSIPFRNYILIETPADSIGFESGSSKGYIRFLKGKDYYFRIRREGPEVVSMIDEVSEQVFRMTLLLSNRPLKPTETHWFDR